MDEYYPNIGTCSVLLRREITYLPCPTGSLRFTTADGAIDAPQGSLMVAPPRASHSFENVSETEEAEIYMTATPGKFPPPISQERSKFLGC